MTIESAQDRLDILTAFGEDATIGVSIVRGVFDKEYREVGGIESLYPVFDCRSSDVTAVTHGTAVTISTTTFEVVGIEDDGTGITSLVLALT